MSVFLTHHTQSLLQTPLPSSAASTDNSEDYTVRRQKLHSCLVQLNSPIRHDELSEVLRMLSDTASEAQFASSGDEALGWAAMNRCVVAVYLQVMESLLSQAAQADEEAQWWRRVEQVGGGTAWYLLQTFPGRLTNLGHQILTTIRSHNHPITLSTFAPSSIDRLFPPNLLSNLLRRSFFPNIQQPYNILRTNPIELGRQECRAKRLKLEEIRDQRAKRLGALASMREVVYDALAGRGTADGGRERLATIIGLLEWSLQDDGLGVTSTLTYSLPEKKGQLRELSGPEAIRTVIPQLQGLLSIDLLTSRSAHIEAVRTLARPSRWMQLWPRVVFLPPLAYLAFKLVFNSQAQLYESLADAKATVVGFWNGWVLEPIRGIVQTVRADHETTMVVSKEGLHSDLDSLERMATSLAREKLNYTAPQLTELSAQIRQGDLTPVLKIYENDIKSPVSSAVFGTLIRSLLIQVQKTKVDIDLAASGIDKLLRSQELTFAFVGVAPSITILYLFSSWVRDLWSGNSGRGRFGGRQRREGAWIAIRRIERLLNVPNAQHAESVEAIIQSSTGREKSLPPSLTTGLLLMSIDHLRDYGVNHLPRRSQLQLGFLEDVDDLEDAGAMLSREDRLRIVHRMWRSWGGVLGWGADVVSHKKK